MARERIEKLSLGKKLAFGAGDSTFSLLFTTLNFYFLFFLTDGIGLSASLAAWIFFIGKIWDSVSDPVMGYISDRTESRWGRRRPYLLFGALPFAVSYILLWQTYPIESETSRFALYAVLAVIHFTGFTVLAVPYSALMPELTLDYDDRTSLVSFRMMFSIIFSIAGAALPMMFVRQTGIQGEAASQEITAGLRSMAIVFGIAGLVPLMITFLGTRERFQVRSRISISAAFRETLKNTAFRYAMLVFLLTWVTVDIIGAVFVYFVTYYLQRQHLIEILFVTMFGVAVCALPLWYKVSERIGKRWSFIIGTAFLSIVMVTIILMPRHTAGGVLILLSALAGVGISTAHVIPWAIIPECVDIDELKTGQRREGMYTGFLTFLQKLASSFAILAVGGVLGLAGYEAGMPQRPPALTAIRLLLGGFPCFLFLLAILLMYFYPVTRSKYGAIRKALQEKKSISSEFLKSDPA